MKNLSIAFSILALSAVSASAADLAPRPYTKAPPPPAAVWNWTGFYAGLNAGGTSSNNSSVRTTSTATSFTSDPDGLFASGDPQNFANYSATGATGNVGRGNSAQFIGGGQIGYNQQFSSNFVAGFEADIQGLGSRGSRGSATNTQSLNNFFNIDTGNGPVPDTMTTTISATNRLDYLGTVRARLGVLVTPTFLAYGTGGLAYGGVHASTSIVQTNDDLANTLLGINAGTLFAPQFVENPTARSAGSVSNTRTGFTGGFGLEWLLGRNVSAKAEYLYYDLGSVSYGLSPLVTTNTTPTASPTSTVQPTSTTRFAGNIFRVGINYQFNGPGAGY